MRSNQRNSGVRDTVLSDSRLARGSKSITLGRLKEVLSYDSSTGLFRWLVRLSPRRPVGAVAGAKMANYISIQIDGVQYKAHRLAWLYVTGRTPKTKLDHKDRNGFNNRFKNLREATTKQNGENRKLDVRSTSGVTGVTWSSKRQKWVARIGHNGKRITLGNFKNKAQAVTARRAAENRLFTHHVQ